MNGTTYVTFVKWEHEGTTYERTQEQYDINSVLCYVRHLDLTKRKAVTHIYDRQRNLLDVVNWNDHH